MTNQRKIYMVLGLLITAWGVILSVVYKNPHFYTLLALGLSIIFFILHKKMGHRDVFAGWKFYSFFFFFTILTCASIVVDVLGLELGYWVYPHYSTVFDEVLKYIFEWSAALFSFFMILVIGADVFEKMGVRKNLAHVLSLFVFVTLGGLVTEYLNLYAYSWQVLKMPFTNWSFHGYFIVFQTLGYWLMALVPYGVYFTTQRLLRHYKHADL